MRKEPHGSVGLGSLSLQELPQQSLHLPVPGVSTFHCLLCVKSIKRSERTLQNPQFAAARSAGHGRKREKNPVI